MYLEIITPEKILYSDDIKRVKVPGVMGSFEILKNHAPVISSLEEGIVKIIDIHLQTLYYKISEGVIECKTNQIIILVRAGEETQV